MGFQVFGICSFSLKQVANDEAARHFLGLGLGLWGLSAIHAERAWQQAPETGASRIRP